MDLKGEMRSFITTGCVSAIIAAIPLAFAIGIGGALVSAVTGVVVSSVVGIVRNRMAQNAKEALSAHTQIQGVLDSSQLDGGAPSPEEIVPFAGRGKVVAVVISLVSSLATGAIVGALTHGTGINFYLGELPTASKPADKTPTKDAANAGAQSSNDTGSSWVPTYEEETVETTYVAPEEPAQNETAPTEPVQQEQQPTAPNTPQETQTIDAGTGGTPSQETSPAPAAPAAPATDQPAAQPTPADSGTISTEAQAI